MALDPWYKIALPREEVREGRSFNPDEFAIALEQVVGGTAPTDYRDPGAFFARTCFTRALREHAGMVLRRLAGKTANTSPVMTLVTQFGGGKTHTLTALYHLVTASESIGGLQEVTDLLHDAGLSGAPTARVAVFVGNAWDPQEGREAPWCRRRPSVGRRPGRRAARRERGDHAAGHRGSRPRVRGGRRPGAGAVRRGAQLRQPLSAHGRSVSCLHQQNLTVAMTGTTHGAAVISLPRSQVEMSDFDLAWQDKITKVVRRVAKDLARERRNGGERGRPAAPVRPHRRRTIPEEGVQTLRRLVLRATRAASAAVDARRQRRHGVKGARASAGAVRSLLPVPSGHAVGLSAEVERAAAVPADPRYAGDAGPVDLLGPPRRLHEGAHGTADHPRLGPARRIRLRRRRARPARRSRACRLPSTPTSPARRRTLGPWTPTARLRSATSTVAWEPRCCSSRRADRWTGWPICPSCASRSASRRSRPPPSTVRRWPSRNAPTSCAGSARTVFGSAIGRPSRRWSTTGARRWTRKARSGRPSATSSRRTSTSARPSPASASPADASSISDTPKLTLVVMDPEVEWTGATGRRRAQTHRGVDSRPRRIAPALPGRPRLGGQEAGPRTAR